MEKFAEEGFKKETGVSKEKKTVEELSREFGQFLNENNPELNEKFKEILPDILETIARFIYEKFPDKREEFFPGLSATVEGKSQHKMKYYDPEKEGYDIKSVKEI